MIVTEKMGLPDIHAVIGDRRLAVFRSDACQKAHKCTMPSKHLLNCSPARRQTLIGAESQEDHETAGCVVFSRTYSALYKRHGHWTVADDCEGCNGPPPTMHSDC